MENLKIQRSGWPIPLFYGIESSGNLNFFQRIVDFLKNCPSPKPNQSNQSKKKLISLLHYFPKMNTKIYAYIFTICDVKYFSEKCDCEVQKLYSQYEASFCDSFAQVY